MRSFTVTTALLLCSLNWISVSGSQTVNVQPGKEVTLMCSNISGSPTHTFWSKLDNTTKISCISSMYGFNGTLEFCTGFGNGKFHMSSNISVVFLNIKQVDLSDSGLYLCGYYKKGHTIIDVRQLNVEGKGNDEPPSDYDDAQCKEPDGVTVLTSVILASVAVLLIMVVVGLLIKVRKLQKAAGESPNPEELNYAALSFPKKSRRTHRPAPERQLEPNVVYAATR